MVLQKVLYIVLFWSYFGWKNSFRKEGAEKKRRFLNPWLIALSLKGYTGMMLDFVLKE